eukprot:g12956.t1
MSVTFVSPASAGAARGTALPGVGAAPRAGATGSSGAGSAAGLAGALCLGALASKGSAGARTKRGSKVVAQALGSIDQFKVFGPPEDPFEIETDKVLGVGGQGTVYLCHKRSTPNVKHAVKTIPIWRLLMDPSCDQKIAEIRSWAAKTVRQSDGRPPAAGRPRAVPMVWSELGGP